MSFSRQHWRKKKKIIKNKKKKEEKRKRGSSNFSYVITRPLFVQNGHQAWGYCLIQQPLNATGRVGKEALLRSLISPSLHCKRQIMDLLTTQLGEENCWRTREKKGSKKLPCTLFDYPQYPIQTSGSSLYFSRINVLNARSI